MSLSELGLAGVPRGALEDPFAGSYYFLEEAGRLTGAPGAPEAPEAPKSPGAPDAVVGQSVAGLVARESAHPAFDVYALRGDFPVLAERVHGRPLRAACSRDRRSAVRRADEAINLVAQAWER
jgi:hypothetical protein